MIRKTVRKRRCAAYLALLLLLLPVSEVHAETADNADVTIQVTTGTQEAAKEREENKNTEAEAEEEYADEAEDTQEIEIAWEDVTISSTADLVAFSRSCWLDTWSRNKRVILTEDLDLTNSGFVSIPTFGGYFDGQGHVIKGLHIADSVSYTGLFCYTQEPAVITNLNVTGTIQPSGNQMVVGGIVGDNSGAILNCTFNGIVEGTDYTGGIAGFNELTGTISGCISQGYVTGMHFTGGITGENMGNIARCTNLAEVNISNEDKGMSLADINLDQYTSALFELGENGNKSDAAAAVNSTVDTGGIAGLSIGVISQCTNQGTVGYEHVGYNVGGIAGRQSGYVYASSNEGLVYGRKDVGGIVGQAEPYVVVDFSQDIVYQLSENINKLHDLISQTIRDAGSESDTVSSRLSMIQSFTDKALQDTSYLSDKTVEWTDGVVSAANEAVSRADYIMDEAAKKDGALDQSKNAASNVKSSATELVKVVDDLDIYQYMSQEEKQQYNTYKKNLEDATKEYNEYIVNATEAYTDYYLDKIRSTESKYNSSSVSVNELNMKPVTSAGTQTGWSYDNTLTAEGIVANYKPINSWVHYDSSETPPVETAFPQTEGEQGTLDQDLLKDRDAKAGQIESDAAGYANDQYSKNHAGASYTADITKYVDGMSGIIQAHMSEMSDSAKTDAKKAVDYAKSAAGNLETAGSEVKNIVTTVNGKSDIALPQLGAEYRAKTGSLVSNLQGMSDNMGYLNSEMASASDTMSADIEAVNDQFNVIMLLYTDAIDGALDQDYTDVYEDNSEEVAEECTDATIADCTNAGEVKGAIDTAGIAGTMAIEYDFDLESDVTGIDNAKANSTYQTKCVLRKNRNSGSVTAQKSYAGGIVGLQEMGTVLDCEGYGKIESTSGDYVGGIAGQSLSYIRKSYAKCALTGGSYVAGIAGSGTNLLDCCAMVRVVSADAFYGAIAGETTEDGKVRRNYFVGEELAGIDRISYSGKAEPLSYAEMMEQADIPASFTKMTVEFLVDDTKVKTMECQYGEPLSAADYPEIPQKDGFYAQWDLQEMNEVVFDETVSAEYVRYLTTLAGSQVRENGQSDFLVDGKFKEGDHLETTLYDTEGIPIKRALEHWKVSFPQDGSKEHQLRYQAPDQVEKAVDIYVKNGEKWEKVTTDSMGSYQLFTIVGEAAEIVTAEAGKEFMDKLWLLGIPVLLVLVGIIYYNKKKKHVKKKNPEKTLEEVEV